jgi:solute carrier family 25 phosphate transporter 23/24/25/41
LKQLVESDAASGLTFQDFIRVADTDKVLEFSPQTLQDIIDSLVQIEPPPPPPEPVVEELIKEQTQVEFWAEKFNADTIKHLVAGGVAGAVSRTAVSPMERMKILFQVQGPEPAAYQGIMPTLMKMWKEEGLMGFLRGNGTNVVRIVPYSATQFAAYEQFKTVRYTLTKSDMAWPQRTDRFMLQMLMEPGKTELDTARRLTAGALAGLVSVACTYPLDIVRTRLAVQSATLSGNASTSTVKVKQPGIMRTMSAIYYTEGGISGLYRGLWPTLLVRTTIANPKYPCRTD